MKKLSLLMLCVTVALTSMATANFRGNAYRPLDKKSHSQQQKAPSRIDIITEQPEGEVVSYMRSGELLATSMYGIENGEQTGRVKLVFAPDGKTVYIQDPLCYAEGSGVWVYGELSEDGLTISVPLGQYAYYDAEFNYGMILSWGSTDYVDLGDDFYWVDFYPDESVTEVQYAINPDNGTITMLGSEGDLAQGIPGSYIATGLAGVWDDDGGLVTIEWNTSWTMMGEATPAIPANPEAIEFFDCGDESGYTRFDFNINLIDIDGNPLDPDYLTYSIFMDNDELFTFDYDTYGVQNGFDTDMTEIPYAYSGEDFYLRRVYFYRTNMGDNPMFDWRIGIQLNYTVNGVTNKSDIVYLEVYPEPTAVNELDAASSVSSVRYFNMAGQEMAQPSGLTIQVTTYSDGSTTAVKVIK